MTAPVAMGPAYGTTQVVDQSVSTPAELISGITAYTLDKNKQNTMWFTADADVRYLWDGTSPTTTHGHLFAAKTGFMLRGKRNILNFRFLGDGGSAAVASITLYDSASGGGVV